MEFYLSAKPIRKIEWKLTPSSITANGVTAGTLTKNLCADRWTA